MAKRGLEGRIPPVGTRVRMTGKALASMGLRTGSAGLDRWLTVACTCAQCVEGRWVAVNEAADQHGYDDLPLEQRPKWRHIGAAGLEVVGAKPRAADYT